MAKSAARRVGRPLALTGAVAALVGGLATAPTAAAAADDYTCGQTSCSFIFTGAQTTFVVPAGVSRVTVSVAGGKGGSNRGGFGGDVRFLLTVASGDVLTGLVGKDGEPASGAQNGSGGGASLLAKNGTVLAIAGGGGGGTSGLKGGNGGGADRCQAGDGESSGGTAPTGGTATAAGKGGVGAGSTGGSGAGPASGLSPASGGLAAIIASSPYNGGGGGEGYYGGGAGGSAPATGGAYQAGAGGSGYLAPGLTSTAAGMQCNPSVTGRVTVLFDLPNNVDVPAVHPYMAIGGVAAAGLTGAAFWLRRRTARGRAAAS